MDRYIARAKTRTQSLPRPSEADKMAAARKSPTRQQEGGEEEMSPASSAEKLNREEDHSRIAEAVAALLRPTIKETVTAAVKQGMEQMRREMAAQHKAITEAEERISVLEDDSVESQNKIQDMDRNVQSLLNKIDDLENRARRNNIRIIGLPETYKPQTLMDICATTIPNLLGVTTTCIAERAHRLGTYKPDSTTSRPVIVKYLNYTDKAMIMQQFRKSRSLVLDGHKLLIFADYSMELSRKRKSFQKICTSLYKNQIKFILAYPAVLRIQLGNGEQHSFSDPDAAEVFLNQIQSSESQNNQNSQNAHSQSLSPKSQRTLNKTPKSRRQFDSSTQKYRNPR